TRAAIALRAAAGAPCAPNPTNLVVHKSPLGRHREQASGRLRGGAPRAEVRSLPLRSPAHVRRALARLQRDLHGLRDALRARGLLRRDLYPLQNVILPANREARERFERTALAKRVREVTRDRVGLGVIVDTQRDAHAPSEAGGCRVTRP